MRSLDKPTFFRVGDLVMWADSDEVEVTSLKFGVYLVTSVIELNNPRLGEKYDVVLLRQDGSVSGRLSGEAFSVISRG